MITKKQNKKRTWREKSILPLQSIFTLGLYSCDKLNGGNTFNFYSSLLPESLNAIIEQLPNHWNLNQQKLLWVASAFLTMANRLHILVKILGQSEAEIDTWRNTPDLWIVELHMPESHHSASTFSKI